MKDKMKNHHMKKRQPTVDQLKEDPQKILLVLEDYQNYRANLVEKHHLRMWQHLMNQHKEANKPPPPKGGKEEKGVMNHK